MDLLAIRPALLVREELLLANAVVAALLVLVELPFVEKPLEDLLQQYEGALYPSLALQLARLALGAALAAVAIWFSGKK